MKKGQLLSELLRPRQLDDLTLPQWVIDRLQQMIDEKDFMNMLFYGQPGIGKTSAARILSKAATSGSRTLANVTNPPGEQEFNGSSATGIDFVRTTITRFATSMSFTDGPKLCVIDEADYMSKNAQAGLRKVIEDYYENCRFLLVANDRSKIIDAVDSRLVAICFDFVGADRKEVKEGLFRRYVDVLTREGIPFDDKRLVELIGIYYPDLRSIANHLEFEFA
jgi:DNA polymerase III delta prime subunit